ncbi:MAG: HAMP domain-containing histidine kinase [Lachnospiraceae bacterium]|nr:HAMP domain-containing histidine kinase [Lachnospiraceae bacterium]
MKKINWRRVWPAFLQHCIFMCIMLLIAGILFNSFITVQTGQGTKTYELDPLDAGDKFEETELYHTIFTNAIGEIINLVVLKEEMETEGYFNPDKMINISEYVNRKVPGANYEVTAFYRLEDLIKWGKYGVVYTERIMNKEEFMEYFPLVYSVDNFGVDEFGQLYFKGFHGEQESRIIEEETSEERYAREAALAALLEATPEEKLEELIFSYLMAGNSRVFSMSKEENSQPVIHVTMLNCRYANEDGVKLIAEQVDNWTDYVELQNNLVQAVESLHANYEQYRISNSLYAGINTNLKYCIRFSDKQGVHTYSNIPEMLTAGEEDVTEFFSEYKRYFIYYPDDLTFSGNTNLTERDVYDNLSASAYAFPETTHIWMGIDTDYAVKGDAFYNANEVYNRVVPNVSKVMLAISALFILWVVIWVYLSLTAGVIEEEDGSIRYYLTWIDHIWTEVVLALAVAVGVGCYMGLRGIMDIAAIADVLHNTNNAYWGINMTRIYEYGTYGLYGFSLSFAFTTIWYSLMRRIRSGNLFKESLCYYIYRAVRAAVFHILYHSNVSTRILLPYNIFLLMNLIAVFGVFQFMGNIPVVLLIVALIVVFDGMVGIFIFKQGMERKEIVDGINKIRDGEVEYKVEVDNLHGANRELADAVNNIGEGIRKAVRTSMKDEQMKTDLITNVSHDIKTPLTSIISYIDLLKRLKLEEEPAKSYIEVLDTKAHRLKQLTDDLVEASKISSGNITLNMEALDLTEMVKQAIGEFSEKLEEKDLQIVFTEYEESACVYADGRRMWRVIENLLNNVYKYALESTRVYIDLVIENGIVHLSVKNISAYQMNIKPEELTERFIRGDTARSTEGSGLGLSIAKSLILAQGGNFVIYLDGDLFKVTISFPEYKVKEENVTVEE